MTREERELRARVSRSRARLIARADTLARTVRSGADPFGEVRRNPMASVVACVSAGMLVGGLAPVLGRRRRKETRADGLSAGVELISLALPVAVPLIASWLKERRAEPTP